MVKAVVIFSFPVRKLQSFEFDLDDNDSTSYYLDLIDEEKEIASRYITSTGKWHWMTPFSPSGSNEVDAVHEEEIDFGHLSETDILDLSYGISRVLAFYERIGRLSFNLSLFSARRHSLEAGFHCLLKIISRQNLYSNYRNDDYFLQKLLQSELIIDLPEEQAERLRKLF